MINKFFSLLLLLKFKKSFIGFFLFLTFISSLFELFLCFSIVPYVSMILDRESFNGSKIYSMISVYIDPNLNLFFTYTIFLIVLIIFSNSLLLINRFIVICFSNHLGQKLSYLLLSNYLTMNFSHFIGYDLSYLQKNVFEEVQRIVSGVAMPICTIFSKLVLIISISTGLFIFNAKIFIIMFLILGFIYLLLNIFIRKKLFNNSNKLSLFSHKRFNLVYSTLASFIEQKIFQSQSLLLSIFSNINVRYFKTKTKCEIMSELPRYLIESVVFVTLLTLILLIHKSSNNQDILAQLAFYLYCGYKILPCIQQIFSCTAQLKTHSSALNIIFPDVNLKKQDLSGDIITDFKNLNCNSISFKFKNQFVFRNISFSIKALDWCLIKGSTGSGKSTLIYNILGLLKPNSGHITINDKSLNDLSLVDYYSLISFVPQQTFIYSGTLRDNICLFDNNPDEMLLNKIIRILHLDNISLSLNDTISNNGSELSGGQKQRLSIARALYRKPKILIMDEPTSAQDSYVENQIFKNIKLNYSSITLIVISHNPKVSPFFNNIINLEK